jgi:heat shock protein 1/8
MSSSLSISSLEEVTTKEITASVTQMEVLVVKDVKSDAPSSSSESTSSSKSVEHATSSNKPHALPVGIDLGTTYSCVAVYQNGRVNVIANDMGDRTTRSIVSFAENQRLVGAAANSYLSSDPEYTVYGAKRLIGKVINDPSIKTDLEHWPFRVGEENVDGQRQTRIHIPNDSENVASASSSENTETSYKTFAPEQISAMVLENLKQAASQFLGAEVTEAVITVPAYFNDSQRTATILAGKLAGLKVLQILNEPTAAAMAYGLEKLGDAKEFVNLVVFDFGGGTLDVTLMRCQGGTYHVVATTGDTHLGGEDLDMKLVEYCLQTWKKTLPEKQRDSVEVTSQMRSLLRIACEQSKRTLSHAVQTTIMVNNFYQGKTLKVPLSRARFEEMGQDLFQRCLLEVDKAFSLAQEIDKRFTPDTIKHVVLVGGSSRIPKIREILDKRFPRKGANGEDLSILCHQVNPDEVVAEGAAIQAAALTNIDDERLSGIVLVDVVPLSLGVETVDGMMDVIISRNSPIPTKQKKIYSTVQDNQPHVAIDIYEGVRTKVCDNRKLGRFLLKGIAPAKKGQPRIEVSFELDGNGILIVTAKDMSSGKVKKMPINRTTGQLSDSQVQKMLDDAERYREQDNLLKQRAEAINRAEMYLTEVRAAWRNLEHLTNVGKVKGEENIALLEKWLEENQATATADSIMNNVQQMRVILAPYFAMEKMSQKEEPPTVNNPESIAKTSEEKETIAMESTSSDTKTE